MNVKRLIVVALAVLMSPAALGCQGSAPVEVAPEKVAVGAPVAAQVSPAMSSSPVAALGAPVAVMAVAADDFDDRDARSPMAADVHVDAQTDVPADAQTVFDRCRDAAQPRLCVMRERAAQVDEACASADTPCQRRNLARRQARAQLSAFEQARITERVTPNPNARPALTDEELAARHQQQRACGFDKFCHQRVTAAEVQEVCGDDLDCHERNDARNHAREKNAAHFAGEAPEAHAGGCDG